MGINLNTSNTINSDECSTELMESVSGCKACSLHMCRDLPVFGRGDMLNSSVMLVYSNPTVEEASCGKALEGDRYIPWKWAIGAMGLDVDKVFFTPVIKCRPVYRLEDRLECNYEHLSVCRNTHLRSQILHVRPEWLLISIDDSEVYTGQPPDDRVRPGAVGSGHIGGHYFHTMLLPSLDKLTHRDFQTFCTLGLVLRREEFTNVQYN